MLMCLTSWGLTEYLMSVTAPAPEHREGGCCGHSIPGPEAVGGRVAQPQGDWSRCHTEREAGRESRVGRGGRTGAEPCLAVWGGTVSPSLLYLLPMLLVTF